MNASSPRLMFVYTRTTPVFCRFLLELARFLLQHYTFASAHGRVCVCVCFFYRAPLVLSLIPVSGKHQPFKTQTTSSPPPPTPLVLLLAPNLGNSWGGHGDDLSPSARPLDRLRACTRTHKYSLGETRTLTNSRIYTQLNIQSV